jgi:N-acylneuraminate cytidylyltransferase
MIHGQDVFAVIPARGGSKRTPGKNLRVYKGRWLLEWTVDAIKGSSYIDRWAVSTEDEKIAGFARNLDYPVIQRPPELATDDATNEDVLRHAWTSPHGWIVLLQPTSPLRTAEDIDACIERAVSNGSAALTVDERGHKNGAVYVASPEWLAVHDFSHAGYAKHVMPDSRSLDIDYPEDFA